MVGKNNKRLLREKHANKFKRYALKKLTVGLASVTIGTGLAFATSSSVSADELAVGERTAVVSDKTAEEQSQPDTPHIQEQEEAVTSAEEPQVAEDRISEEKAVKEFTETEEKATESKEVAEEKQADSHEQTEETSDKEETNTKAPQTTTTQLAPVVESEAEPIREEQPAEAPTTTLSQIDQLPEEFLTYLRDHSDIVDFKNTATIETYANLLQQSYGVEAAKEERIRAIEAAVKEIESTKEQAKNEVVDQTERLIDADKDSTTPQDQSKETFKKTIQQADNPQTVVESYLKDAGYKAEDIAGILANVDMSLANDPDQLLDNIVQAGVKYANENKKANLLNVSDRNINQRVKIKAAQIFSENQITPLDAGEDSYIRFEAQISIEGRVKEGDYFEIRYDEILTPDGLDLNSHNEYPPIRSANGDILARPNPNPEEKVVRYTFTPQANNRTINQADITFKHAINRSTVTRSGQHTVDYYVGDPTREENHFSKEIEVVYPDAMFDTSHNVAGNINFSYSFEFVRDNGEYRQVFYANPKKSRQNNMSITLFSDGRELSRGQGPRPTVSQLNRENSNVRIYEVLDTTKLNPSMMNDYTNSRVFKDVSNQFSNRNNFSNNTTRLGFGNTNKAYVVVVDSKTRKNDQGQLVDNTGKVYTAEEGSAPMVSGARFSYVNDGLGVNAANFISRNTLNAGAVTESSLYEMTVEDIAYPIEYRHDPTVAPGQIVVREDERGQSGRQRILYRHIDPNEVPDFNPGNFVNMRGSYWEEVSRETIQEAKPQIVRYNFVSIVSSTQNDDGGVTITYSNGQEVTIPGPKKPDEPQKPLRPIITKEEAEDGSGTTVKIEMYNPNTDQIESKQEIFIENGKRGEPGTPGRDGDPGKDGRTPSVHTERNEDTGETIITFYYDTNNDGTYTEGEDELIRTETVKDGKPGDPGTPGDDGRTPSVDTTRNEEAGETTITFYYDTNNDGTYTEGEDELIRTETVKDGKPGDPGKPGDDGRTPSVDTTRNEEAGETTITFYYDTNNDGTYTEGEDELIRTETVKDGKPGDDGRTPSVDTTRNEEAGETIITFYYDTNNDGAYTEGEDELIRTETVKDGKPGDPGKPGDDGRTPSVDTTRNEEAGETTITFYYDTNNDGTYTEGEDELIRTETVKDGKPGDDGRTPSVDTTRNEEAGETIITFYYDTNNDGAYTEGEDELIRTETVKDGKPGEDGRTPSVDTTRNEETGETIITFYYDTNNDGAYTEGEDELIRTETVKDGKPGEPGAPGRDGNPGEDGRTPSVDTTRNEETGETIITFYYDTNNDGTYTEGEDELIRTETVKDGKPGEDGRTPSVDTTRNEEAGETIITFYYDTNNDGAYTEGEDELIRTETVKDGKPGEDGRTPSVDTTRNEETGETIITFYYDTNNDGAYTEGEDELIRTETVKDGKPGEPGAPGRDGKPGEDGRTPSVDTTRNEETGETIITFYYDTNNDGAYTEGEDELSRTETVKDGKPGEPGAPGRDGNPGEDGRTPSVDTTRNEETGETIITFYYDTNNDGTYTEGEDELIRTETVKDGKPGDDGRTPSVDTTRNEEAGETIITFYYDTNNDGAYTEGEDELIRTETVKDGKPGEPGAPGRDGNPGEDGRTPSVDTTRNEETGETIITFYYDTNNDGAYTEGEDELIRTETVKDGKPGDPGKPGDDGRTPSVDTTRNEETGETIITFYYDTNNDGTYTEGEDELIRTETVKDGKPGEDGRTPSVDTTRNEETGETIITFYYDTNNDGAYTEGEDELIRTETVKDGKPGEDGRTPSVDTTRNEETGETIITFYYDTNNDGTYTEGEDELIRTETVKDGKPGDDGRTPSVDTTRNEEAGETISTFYYDTNNDGAYTEGEDELIRTETVKDGKPGEPGAPGRDGNPGEDGRTPSVDTTRNEETGETIITFYYDTNNDGTYTEGEDELIRTETVKDGKPGDDGRTPSVDTTRNEEAGETIITFYYDTNNDGAYTEGEDELIRTETVKDGKPGDPGKPGDDGRTPSVDTTRNEEAGETTITFYYDTNNDGTYTEGEDELIRTETVKDGKPGEPGAPGRDGNPGEDGRTPSVDTTRNEEAGETIITFYYDTNNDGAYTEGEDELIRTETVKDGKPGEPGAPGRDGNPGEDGRTPSVDTTRNEEAGETIITFYYDTNNDGAYTEGEDELIRTETVKDGKPGEPGAPGRNGNPGEDGRTPSVDTTRNEETGETIITFYYDTNNDGTYTEGEDELIRTETVKDGKPGDDGRTPSVDTTRNEEAGETIITFYYDTNNDGAYTEGEDELIRTETVKDGKPGDPGKPGDDGRTPSVDTTRNEEAGETTITFYYDTNNDGTYTEGEDELIRTETVKDGKPGEPGAPGRDGNPGEDGRTPSVDTTRNEEAGETIITFYYDTNNDGAYTEGEDELIRTETVKDGKPGDPGKPGDDGRTPSVDTTRNEEAGETTITFYYDTNNDGTYTEGEDELIRTETVKDGKPGEPGAPGSDGNPGEDGRTPSVDTTRNEETGETIITFYYDTNNDGTYTEGEDELIRTETVKDGKPGDPGKPGDDGRTPSVDTTRNEEAGETTITFYYDTNNDGTYTEGEDELIRTETVKDGKPGDDGRTPSVDTTRNEEAGETIITFYYDTNNDGAYTEGEDELIRTETVKDGKPGEPGAPGRDGNPGEDGRTPSVDTTRNEETGETIITFYYDTNNDGAYTEGEDELIRTETVKDGKPGEPGAPGRDGNPGEDGRTPSVDTTRNEETGETIITFYYDTNNDGTYTEGEDELIRTETVKDGKPGDDGRTPSVDTTRNEEAGETIITFYYDTNNDGAYTEGEDELIRTETVKDGKPGDPGKPGDDGRTPSVDTTRNEEAGETTITFYYDTNNDGTYTEGEDELIRTETVKDGKPGDPGKPGDDGRTPSVDTTRNEEAGETTITFYYDTNNDGTYTEGEDELIRTETVKDGKPGDPGKPGDDGRTPSVDTTRNEETGETIITFYYDTNNDGTYTEGEDELIRTETVKDGKPGDPGKPGDDGRTPSVDTTRNEEAGETTITFYYDTNNDGTYTEGEDELIRTETVKDGKPGDPGKPGDDGRTPSVDTTRNEEAGETTITFYYDTNNDGTYTEGEDELIRTETVKDGKPGDPGKPGDDGRTPSVDTTRNEEAGETTITFYYDTNNDGTYTEGEDELIRTETVKDGQPGEPGENGKPGLSPRIDTKETEIGLEVKITQRIYDEQGNIIDGPSSTHIIRNGEDGKSITVERTETDRNGNTVVYFSDGSKVTIAKGDKGDRGEKGEPGKDGKDGNSVTASVERGEQNGRPGTYVIIRNEDGTEIDREFIFDGENGQTPTIESSNVLDSDGQIVGTRIIIRDGNGHVVGDQIIRNGKDGQNGKDGEIPTIGSNGNWFIAGKDTGVKAKGEDGQSITITKETRDADGNTIVHFSDGSTVTISKGDKGDQGQKGDKGERGQTPNVSQTPIRDQNGRIVGYTLTFTDPVTGEKIGNSIDVYNGTDGKDSKSVTASVERGEQNGRPGSYIIIRNEDGVELDREFVFDGEDGTTPKVSVQTIERNDGRKTHVVTITNPKTGETQTFTVTDGEKGEAGQDGKDGRDGRDGRDGKNGFTPTIGSNGNWFIAGQDTGVKAKGEDGQSITVTKEVKDEQGNTVVHFSDGSTITISKGDKGETGPAGKDGHDGRDGKDGKDLTGNNGNINIENSNNQSQDQNQTQNQNSNQVVTNNTYNFGDVSLTINQTLNLNGEVVLTKVIVKDKDGLTNETQIDKNTQINQLNVFVNNGQVLVGTFNLTNQNNVKQLLVGNLIINLVINDNPVEPGKPAQPETTPERPSETPDNTPEQPNETPNVPSTPEETPGQPGETPEAPGTSETPDNTPEQPNETPNVPSTPEGTPGQPGKTPETPGTNETPGNTPEQPNETPNVPSTPEETPGTPGQPGETPNVPSTPEEAPGQSGETPEAPGTNETPGNTPEQPNETPNVPSTPEEAPGQPGETPEAPGTNETPNTPTQLSNTPAQPDRSSITGERLPETATDSWMLALASLVSLSSGAVLAVKKKKDDE